MNGFIHFLGAWFLNIHATITTRVKQTLCIAVTEASQERRVYKVGAPGCSMTNESEISELVTQIAQARRDLRAAQAWDRLALHELRGYRSMTVPVQFSIRQSLRQEMHTLTARIQRMVVQTQQQLHALSGPARCRVEAILKTHTDSLDNLLAYENHQ